MDSSTGSGEIDAPGQAIPKFRREIYLAGFVVAVMSTAIILTLTLKTLFCVSDKSKKRLALLLIILITALSFSIATLAQVGVSHHPDDINSAMAKTESLAVLGVGIFAALTLASTWRSCFFDKNTTWTVYVTHFNKLIFSMLVVGWMVVWLMVSYFDVSQDEFSVARAVAVYSATIVTSMAIVCFVRLLYQICVDDKAIKEARSFFKILLMLEMMCMLIAVLWGWACVSIDIRTRYATNYQASRFILTLFIGPLAILMYFKTTDKDETKPDSAIDYNVSATNHEIEELTSETR